MGLTGFLMVFLGGGVGSAARHGVNVLAARFFGANYPIGTFTINIIGAFTMGAVVEWLAMRASFSPVIRLFLTTGIIGGFTTFSTYALEIAALYERGEFGIAVVYALASIVLGLAALFLGMQAVKWLYS